MAIQDMDICLNVTAEPVIAAKKKKVKSFGASGKKLWNQFSQKKTAFNSEKSKRNKNIQQTKDIEKVKQESSSVVFSNKSKETNTVTRDTSQQSHVPPAVKGATTILTKSNKTKQLVELNNKDSKSNKTLSAVHSDSVNESTVTFIKPTKQHIGKTLLAKKRHVKNDEAKKFLSEILSNRSEKQNQLNLNATHEHDSEKYIKPSKVSKIYKAVTEKSPDSKIIRTKVGKQWKRGYKERYNDSDVTANDIPKLTHRDSGKVSSLFGNNPEVPMIGQRLVKPVNEPIFTQITFADLDIHPFSISNLEQNMGITKMTTVQQKAIPQIFSARDVLVRSQTGSGKTLAYSLPVVELLHKIRPKLSRSSGLSALVIVPTRELALQTYECFIKLVKPFTWIVPGYLIGGEKRKAEKARLRKGCNILIATPGRLLDHIKHTEALRLNEVKYFILDEADRMLDMGYEKDISEIVSVLKVSSKNESNYDAMKIFKQNSKKIFKNDIEDNEVQTETISNMTGEYNSEGNEQKLKYHSSDDSDDNEIEYIVPMKKKTKGTKVFQKNKEASSKTENNTEQSGESVNQSGRQTILLSATLTQSVEKLAGLAMRNPIFVDAAKENLEASDGNVGEINEDLVVPQSVAQSYIITPPKLRMVTLSAYIAGKCQTSGNQDMKILIFMATQDMVDYHTEILSSILTKPVDDIDDDSDPLVDVEFFKLYGNMTQKDRTEVFKTFRQTRSGVLLCTDVAARGLDMPKVNCVIQYTGPTSARDYVHRIGRTARAGSSGTSTIFLTPPEIEFVRMLESRRIRIKQEDMNDVLDKLVGPFSRHNSVQAAAIALQNDFETLVLENQQLAAKACKAYLSWVRFYSSYPRDMREIFNRRELHLGHYAKSFALRHPPQRISGIGKKLREQEESSAPKHNNRLANKQSDEATSPKKQKSQDGSERRARLLKRVRMLNTSEYESGIEPSKKPKK